MILFVIGFFLIISFEKELERFFDSDWLLSAVFAYYCEGTQTSIS